jgi:hypothetical protein
MSILGLLSAPLAVLLLAVPAYADLLTFNSRAAFNATAPGLPVETFEAGLATILVTCPGPVSSSAASACFPLGGLLPGVVYSASGAANTQLSVLGPRFGPPSKIGTIRARSLARITPWPLSMSHLRRGYPLWALTRFQVHWRETSQFRYSAQAMIYWGRLLFSGVSERTSSASRLRLILSGALTLKAKRR